MAKDGEAFARWLDEARIPQTKRTPHQLAILKATFAFLQQAGRDYASRRLVAHFLLNCQLGLKLAHVARLVDITRPSVDVGGGRSSVDFTFVRVLSQNGTSFPPDRNETILKLKGIESLRQTPPNECLKVTANVRPAEVSY